MEKQRGHSAAEAVADAYESSLISPPTSPIHTADAPGSSSTSTSVYPEVTTHTRSSISSPTIRHTAQRSSPFLLLFDVGRLGFLICVYIDHPADFPSWPNSFWVPHGSETFGRTDRRHRFSHLGPTSNPSNQHMAHLLPPLLTCWK